MLIIIGTVPLPEGIYEGAASFKGKNLQIGRTVVPVERGSGALTAAALRILGHYGAEKPYCLLAGDRLSGDGSNKLLEASVSFLPDSKAETAVLHYMFVLLKYGPMLREAVQSMTAKPFLIGDAGGMYLAKASGISGMFDIFTPDRGELAFLADDQAAHPMYTRPEFFNRTDEELARTAWEAGNSPQTLVVKGKTDLVLEAGQVVNRLAEPSVPVMEAIGGTGDTVTGMLAALLHLKIPGAACKALLLNRLAGEKTGCTPRTQIAEFIDQLSSGVMREAGVGL
jgi:hypothetical protein